MRLCTHCNGLGRWSDGDVQHGAPALRAGICGKECGYCEGDGMNLGVETDSVEEHEAVQAWADGAAAWVRVEALRVALAEAEEVMRAEEARHGCHVEDLGKQLGIPDEVLARVHWARRP